MLCPNCSTENTDDSKFCMTCGERLAAGVGVGASGEDGPDAAAVVADPGEEPATVLAAPDADPAPVADAATADTGNPWLPDAPPPPRGAVAEPDEAESPAPPLPPPPADQGSPPAPPEGVPPSLLASSPSAAAPVPESDAASLNDVPAPPIEPSPGVPGDPNDPHGLGAQLDRMSEATRPHAEVPTLIAAALLGAAESVSVIVPGLLGDVVGVLVVTDHRVLLVSGRRWKPEIHELEFEPDLLVEGWQEADTAMLTFNGDPSLRISAIVDKPLAFEAARLIRERAAARST